MGTSNVLAKTAVGAVLAPFILIGFIIFTIIVYVFLGSGVFVLLYYALPFLCVYLLRSSLNNIISLIICSSFLAYNIYYMYTNNIYTTGQFLDNVIPVLVTGYFVVQVLSPGSTLSK